MSEERLQEIKDSIELQYTLAKAKGYDNALLFTNEEEELIEEIERLNTDKEQLNSLVNSCQEEIRRLNKKIEIKNNRIQQLMNRTRSARIDKAIAFIKSEKAIKCSGIPIKNFEAYENYLLSVLEGSE